MNIIGFAESALKTTINFQEFKEKQELTKESDIATSMQKLLLPKKLPIIKTAMTREEAIEFYKNTKTVKQSNVSNSQFKQ